MKFKILIAVTSFALLLIACDKSSFLPEFYNGQNGNSSIVSPPDPCLTSACPKNSSCVDGQCECYLGFEGPLCNIGYADKFVGLYQGSDTCNGLTYITILPLKVIKIDNHTIKIEEFGGFSLYIFAQIEKVSLDDPTADKITINYCDFVGRCFVGNGLLKNEDVHGNYTVTYPDGSMETCTFTMERL